MPKPGVPDRGNRKKRRVKMKAERQRWWRTMFKG